MSKKTLYISGIVLTILIGTLLSGRYCCKSKLKARGIIPAKGMISHFALAGEGLNFRCADNFKFPVNGSGPVLPVSDSINLGIKLLKDNFDSDPSLRLVITGYCTSAETNRSAFANLGMARANALKNYFVSRGIAAASAEISGEIKNNLFIRDKLVMGPVDFKLSKVEIKPGQMVLYFDPGKKQTLLSAEQTRAVSDIAQYLEKFPASGLHIDGYTDNVGDREANIRLGMGRADFVKSCFVKSGVAESRIECMSKGPEDPAGDNATDEGRAKNRRTVISVR